MMILCKGEELRRYKSHGADIIMVGLSLVPRGQNLLESPTGRLNSLSDVEFAVDSESEVEMAYLCTGEELRRYKSRGADIIMVGLSLVPRGQNLLGSPTGRL